MKSKIYVPIVVAIAVIAAGASYASPYWTVYEMKSAIDARDAAAFSAYVDFPSVRESMKGQVLGKFQEKMANARNGSNGFAAFGAMLGMGIVNQVIDTMVTPDGVMAIMSSGTAAPDKREPAALPSSPASPETTSPSGSSEASQDAKAKYDIGYQSWSTVIASARNGDSSAVRLVFKREGIWSWKLSGIDFSELHL